MSEKADPFLELTGADLPPDYSLIRQIGAGSMSHVFLVRNTALKRLAALKVLRTELAEDLVGRKRFVREAQAAARVDHPSIAAVYTVGNLENDVPFIEMQYIDGANLADHLQANGSLDATTACTMLAQMASALAAAHACNVIHRDVEPANVLIDRDSGRACLVDFGIAGILETGSEAVTKLTRENERLGSPAYMSPEQLRGEALTEQADIYGLGLVAYEMLTLRGPFGSSEVTDMAGAHLRRAPVDLSEANSEISQRLSDALKRCVSKKPEHRPRAATLAKDFGEIATGSDAPLSEPESALATFLKELQTRKVYRAAVAYAAAVFLILQVADLILEPLLAPSWVYRTIVIVSLALFPAVLALAWIFDLRRGRLVRTGEIGARYRKRISSRQVLVLQALGLILSIAGSGLVAWLLLAR